MHSAGRMRTPVKRASHATRWICGNSCNSAFRSRLIYPQRAHRPALPLNAHDKKVHYPSKIITRAYLRLQSTWWSCFDDGACVVARDWATLANVWHSKLGADLLECHHPAQVPTESDQVTKIEGHHVKIQGILTPWVQSWLRRSTFSLSKSMYHGCTSVRNPVALLPSEFKAHLQ